MFCVCVCDGQKVFNIYIFIQHYGSSIGTYLQAANQFVEITITFTIIFER